MMAVRTSAALLLLICFAKVFNVNGNIVCGDEFSISATSSDTEWGEWEFVDPSDTSSANMYINDVLSLLNNQKSSAGSGTENWVNSQACYLDTFTDSVEMTAALQLAECDPDITVNSTHIMYEYSVWHDPRIISWAINRWPPARVCYTCVMERDYEENSVAIAPQMTIDHYQLAGVEGTFSIAITLWDSTGGQLSANDNVDVGDVVTVKAEMDGVDSTDDTLVLTLEDCWASPTTSYYARYQFLSNHCPVDQCRMTSCNADDAGYTTLIEQANDLIAKVSFTTFVWNTIGRSAVAPDAASQVIYITCRVRICSETYMLAQSSSCIDTASCDDGATNSRRRRSVGNNKYRRSVDEDVYPTALVTANPFHVRA